MRWISGSAAKPILPDVDKYDETVARTLNISEGYTLSLDESQNILFEIDASELLFVCVSAGAIAVQTSKLNLTLSGDSVIALNTYHGICNLTASENTQLTFIIFTGTLWQTLLDDRLEQGAVIAYNIAQMSKMVIASLEKKQKDLSDISLIAYQFLLTFRKNAKQSEQSKEFPWVVEAALNIISEDFSFLAGIPDLAERVEVSTGYLSRAFHEALGISPGHYLTQFKITQAKRFLMEKDISIAMVSDLCGFSNANYFAKVFRQEVGISPSEYAKLASAQPVQSTLPEDIFAI